MQVTNGAGARRNTGGDAVPELKEVVLGLHWAPPQEGALTEPADLDALCALLDERQQLLEIVGPTHPRNADGSVSHTGDSRRGTSEWDDERIFVFLDALPDAVATLAFVVVSASGQPFSEVLGASCHVSDRLTEHEWLRFELTALQRHRSHCVATLHRRESGWEISPGGESLGSEFMAALLARAGELKRNEA